MRFNKRGSFINIILTSVFILLFLSGCIEREKSLRNQALWSSMDPLSIPYSIRMNQFDKGNLIFNPSFETGKYLLDKGDDNSFYVKGWSRVGNNVEWVDLSKETYTSNEVTEGSHAIKITREKASETEEIGEGIISDFIKVIPGNYRLSFDIRLENIKPYKSRLGTKLHDAVNIRIQYFDKNKIKLEGEQYYPYFKSYLDNSFKGYPFSNFWYIDEFGYSQVNGRTYNYPFSEGDIPDNAQYVRIFFGLKGTGTMWIDNADYRFSRWNFTTLEKVSPFFDSTLTKPDLLIPTPKSVEKKEVVTYFIPDREPVKSPGILIPAKSSPGTRKAARILKAKLENRWNVEDGNDSPVNVTVMEGNPGNTDDYSIIFSLGYTQLYREAVKDMHAKLPGDKPQSYLIDYIPGNTPVVYLVGNDPAGEYYAVTTVLQLLDPGNFLFHAVTITDYPDFLGRSFLLNSWQNERELNQDINNIDRMSLLKFNKAYIGYGQTRGRKEWYDPDELYKNGVRMTGKACRENGYIDLALMINPYYHFDYEVHRDSISDDLRYAWSHSDPQSMELLKSAFKRGLDAGAKSIMLMADDYIPHGNGSPKLYSLYTPEDIERFGNLQNAHIHVINSLYQWIRSNYANIRFEFCPPWYLNEFINRSMGKAEHYFSDLIPEIPEDIAIIWTGPTVRSLVYDTLDFKRYTDLIGRKPMIWDNTLYARSLTSEYGGYASMYPGKVRMCNLFEPYDVQIPDNFYHYVDGPHMYVNGAASSEYYKIKYSTVADFEWNNNAYNPDLSLWKTLLVNFGKEQAIQLIQFNDAYYALMDICMKMERGNVSNRLFKQGEYFSEQLHILYSSLSSNLKDNPLLIEEIASSKEDMIDRFSHVEKSTRTLFHRDSTRRN